MVHTVATKGSRAWIAWVVVAVLIAVGVSLLIYRNSPGLAKFLGARGEFPTSTGTYVCDEGKTITAAFYAAPSGGRVSLVLSDGRTLMLPQTIAASGARYAKDESFIFWNKGNTAFIEEGDGHRQTYTGCVTANASPEQGWNTFASSTLGVSARYPHGYTAKPHTYDIGQKKSYGVKFTIPSSRIDGSNLSADTGVSIETLPVSSCSAAAFLPKLLNRKELLITDKGVDYVMATSVDAAAGNRYEEFVYALRGSTPCVAVRYFIHFGNIQNYDQEDVREFDRGALLKEFDQIRQSLVVEQ